MTDLSEWASPLAGVMYDASWKSAAILLATWAIARVMRKSSAALRHVLWSTAVCAVLTVPAASAIVPARAVSPVASIAANMTDALESAAPAIGFDTNPERSRPMNAPIAPPGPAGRTTATSLLRFRATAVVGVWAAGALLIVAGRLVSGVALWRLVRRARPANPALVERLAVARARLGTTRPVRLVVSDAIGVPASCGIFYPTIVLPTAAVDWDDARRSAVLLHELAHVARADAATQALATLACVLHWFDPLVWFAARRMRIERERACDDRVVCAGTPATAYAKVLLSVARSVRDGPPPRGVSMAMAQRSGLGERVRAIVDPTQIRTAPTRWGKWTAVLTVLAVLVPLSAFNTGRVGATGVAVAQTRPTPTSAPAFVREEDLLFPEQPAEAALPGSPAAAGELSGKVVDTAGHPIDGVTVRVWTWVAGRDKTTAADGTFRIKPSANNDRRVEIRFSKPGWSPRYLPHQPTGLADLVVVMNQDTYVEGRLTDPQGVPVPHARVRADQGPKHADGVSITSVWTDTTTDEKGDYRLYLQPDSYVVSARDPTRGGVRTGRIPVRPGDHLRHDLMLTAGIVFRAKVVDAVTGAPVAGVKFSNFEQPDVVGVSDAAGHVEITAMEPGTFRFSVGAAGYARWWSEQAVNDFERRETTRPGKFVRSFDELTYDIRPAMPEVTVTVEPSVTIRGTVVDPAGKPVANATAAPALTGTGNSLTGDTRFSVKTKADGTFEMTLPASGDCDYNLVAHEGGRVRHWANGVLPPFRTKPGDRLNDVRLVLTTPAVVKGRIVDADGTPVARREVRASALDRLENRYYDPTTRTNENGEFTLNFVRAGAQAIQVAPFWLDAGEAPAGTSVTLQLVEGQIITDLSLTAAPAERP